MRTLPPLPEYLDLEHRTARILTAQETYGWAFNERAAWQLESTLRRELEQVTELLRSRYPFVAGSTFNPKRNNKTQGYFAGAESVRLKELNPTSRDHIAWILQTHTSWRPKSLTTTGKAIIDETILTEIGTDLSLMFLKCLELKKQLGMLSEGANAWLKLVKKGRIHHHCSVATNTHRCAHRKPNLAQVPSDERFRRLFIPTDGNVMVGADLSGIELRMLAHYLHRYDEGRYKEILLYGDIHQTNADKIGISRRLVKTVTYAFLYGAGDEKIGYSYDKNLQPKKARSKGAEIRAAFIAAIEGLDSLLKAIKQASERGFVRAIDKRKITVDTQHKALNYLLQSSAAVIAKRWMVIADENIGDLEGVHQLAFVHDELQFDSLKCNSHHLADILVDSAKQAGEFYHMRCPVDAEAKIGNNWAEVH